MKYISLGEKYQLFKCILKIPIEKNIMKPFNLYKSRFLFMKVCISNNIL